MVLHSLNIQSLSSSDVPPEIYNLTNSKPCTILSNKVVDLFDYSDAVGIRFGFTRQLLKRIKPQWDRIYERIRKRW